jgi:hypothetical protein
MNAILKIGPSALSLVGASVVVLGGVTPVSVMVAEPLSMPTCARPPRRKKQPPLPEPSSSPISAL